MGKLKELIPKVMFIMRADGQSFMDEPKMIKDMEMVRGCIKKFRERVEGRRTEDLIEFDGWMQNVNNMSKKNSAPRSMMTTIGRIRENLKKNMMDQSWHIKYFYEERMERMIKWKIAGFQKLENLKNPETLRRIGNDTKAGEILIGKTGTLIMDCLKAPKFGIATFIHINTSSL
jgi:hypothetical protein